MTAGPEVIQLIMELRGQGITDTDVLSAIEKVPRDRFVPEAFRERAFENIALPIAQGQTISQPYIVAYMTQALQVGRRMKVLEIGTGSGYQAAVLAQLCRRVYTIDRYRTLVQEAERRFAELGLSNITTRIGDGMKGWPEQAPFDRIMVTAAGTEIPQALIDQLGPEGVLVAPVGHSAGDQSLVRLRRTGDGIQREELIGVRFVPLVPGLAQDATGP
ncbi:protein-L-isoaspartate(D-aspartate) O-methyltransferase [Desertibaculum subflavum]|uniref:protein-L-isoaspartate(D-aspartate) O-methyltransferase n=1 Tax=Desertibaculum subflavum TaxID=2268458 RepID=UPI0034D2B282